MSEREITYAPKLILFNEKEIRKIQIIFDFENQI